MDCLLSAGPLPFIPLRALCRALLVEYHCDPNRAQLWAKRSCLRAKYLMRHGARKSWTRFDEQGEHALTHRITSRQCGSGVNSEDIYFTATSM